ncbi:MAG: putative solute-binding protein [bacterium]
MTNRSQFVCALMVISGLLLSTGVFAKPAKRSLCVFDVVGTNGPVYNAVKEYRTAALKWGVKFELKPYTDEAVALEDFQAGQCDGVVLTGVRNRQLVKFAGSIDMMGALPSYRHLKKAIRALSQPKAAQYMRTEKYEVAGIFPAGAVYFFVRPESMRKVEGTPTIDDFAGKKVAVMSYDQQGITSIRHVGATPVPSDVTSFAGKFNNGSVDLIYAPASAYNALELYRGLKEDGRIIDYPLAQLTYQITLRRDNFSDTFAQTSREWSANQFNEAKKRIVKVRRKIPEGMWLNIPDKRKPKYRAMFRKVRQRLKEEGVYDPRTMVFLRNIRCNIDPSRAECTMDQSGS